MRRIMYKTTWVMLLMTVMSFGMTYSALTAEKSLSDMKFLSRLGKKQSNLLLMAQPKSTVLCSSLSERPSSE